MRILLSTPLLLTAIGIASPVWAMDAQSMQGMMAAMEQMQTCIAGIEQHKLKELEGRSNAINRELSALCHAGDRDEAQARGIKYAKEISENPDLKKLQVCAEQLNGTMAGMPGMPGMPDMSFPEVNDNNHVCDLIDK
jgi:predicted lipoprotein